MSVVSALVVDTSSWIQYFDGGSEPQLEEALREARVYLPPIVIAELLSGKLGKGEEAQLIDLLATLPICETSLQHWVRVGRLRAFLASKALSVSTPDAHVAQCCLDIGAQLLTRDKVFEHVARKCALQLAG